MSYLKPNTAGVYDIPSANIDTLYVRGKKFQDYITELVFEDQLEQSEITEIKLLLEYLDTTGLNSAWTVTNSNVNETLRASITALQNKLAQIDTTALTESSVLTNDNRNSVLKTAIDTATSDVTALTTRVTTAEGDIDNLETRMTTAEGDIDGVETKTRFIIEASVSGSGDNTSSIYRTKVGPADGVENGATFVELNMKNAPVGDLIGYTIKSNFNDDAYDLNESIYSHNAGRLTLAAEAIRIQATDQCRIGTFQDRDGFSEMDIKIGGQGNKVNIGSVDTQNPTGPLTEIWIGKLGGIGTRSTDASLEGNIYVGNARFPQLHKSSSLTIGSLIALMSSGPPSWVVGFFSGASALPYSDVWCMKGGFLASKDGDVETSNSIMVSELYVVNKDIVSIAPKVGFFLAKADYSCTQLIGDHRTQVFEGEIVMRNNNITSTSVDWALTSANDKCNVVNIGGDDGILIHQGASETGKPLRIFNSCGGHILLELGTQGTLADAKVSGNGGHGMSIRSIPLINAQGNEYQGGMVRMGLYLRGNPDSNPYWGSYQLEINQYPNREGMIIAKAIQGNNYELTYKTNIINGDSITTEGTITGIDVVGTTSISAPTTTTTSIVIGSAYTGDTTNRLYKNADNKLFWNGVELGANVGGGGGGLEYYIPLASNVTNPAPNPTEQIATETYINAEQRTITQSTTAVATGLRMARYTTGIINKDSNPFVEGLQTIQQYVIWSENNTVGQLYGECWFQAEATGGAIVYERSYSAGVQTAGYNVMTSAPIIAPEGLFNLSVKSVIFPGIIIDNFNNGIMTFRCRLEGLDLITENWNTLQTSTIELTYGPEFDNSTQTLTFTEDFVRNQTSTLNAPTQYRFALYTTSPNGNGHFYQANAGSANGDQLAYRLGSASGTASIRVLLYNGVNAKQSITHTTTPSLVPIELPISPLYQIGAFNNGRLAFDIFMYQPSGAVNSNHTMRFFFGEGTISHIESTINEPPAPTPTLAQVLNSGATASQPINMDGKAITGITTLEGSSGGNWNVKEITAGTNISVSSTSGNYTITNDAPTQEVSAGFGIQTAKSGTTATIINNAPVQNLTASSGIAISVDTPTRNATITNTGILGITAGSGLLVTTTNGVATITNTATAGSQVARDQLTATNVVGLVPHKLGHYAQNWTTQSISVQPADIFVSQDGKNCVYIPGSGSAYIQFSNNYGENWFNSNFAADSFVSICGTTTGEVLFVSKFDPTTGQAPNVVYTSRIYASYNHGQSWLDLPMERTPGVANTWYNRFINKIRCSSDASVIAASTILTTSVSGVPNNGTVYISLNSGATWVVRNITAGPAQVADLCMSSNGAIMFAAMNGVLGGATDNGYGGIYRSLDFGETWTKVRNQIAAGSYFFGIIKCDATGRFLVACDQSQSANPATGQIQSSDDYGANWFFFGDSQAGGATAAFVSPGGNFMITAHNTAYNSQIRYSTDYGKNWTTAYTLNAMMGTDTIRALASNHDGSLLLVGGSVAAAIYRSFEERGRLSSVVGSRDLTITPAFGGGYTLFNNPVETLWFSGGFEVTTSVPLFNIDFDWSPAGKIDLTQYNLRYEIECYWNTGTPSHAFPLLVINRVKNTDVPGVNDNQLAYDGLSGLTNWTNTINNGAWQGGESYNQTYRNRFFAGYFPPSTTNLNAPATDQIRQRTLMTGLLSLHKRPLGQAGITDPSVNARDILNKFHCDNYTTRFTNGMSYLLNSNSQQGIDYAVNHHRMDGTAIFPAESVWSYNAIDANSSMANGIVRLGFYLCDGFNVYDTRARSGYYTYKIYRVRK